MSEMTREETFESSETALNLGNEYYADLIYADILAANSFRFEEPKDLVIHESGKERNWAKIAIIVVGCAAGVVGAGFGLKHLMLKKAQENYAYAGYN